MSRFLLLAALVLPLAACQSDDTVDETPDVSETVTQDDPMVTEPSDATAGPSTPLNLNTATGEQFATIPGVGDRMVHEFEEYRPYTSIGQFRREIGKYVDEDVVAGYEDYVFVPIDPNESDEETLQQLPGVDAEAAAALVASRPYADDEAFLASYAEATGEDGEAHRFYLASE